MQDPPPRAPAPHKMAFEQPGQSEGVYDVPKTPLFTLNVNWDKKRDLRDIHNDYRDHVEAVRRKLKREFKTVVKIINGKRLEFSLTPEKIYVFSIAFTDGKSTVTAIIEGTNMWVRGFMNSDGQVFEFLDEDEDEDEDKKVEEDVYIKVEEDVKGKSKKQQQQQKKEELKKEEHEQSSRGKKKVMKEEQQQGKKFSRKKQVAGLEGSRRPRKFIRGSILLNHSSNYRKMLRVRNLDDFRVGYEVLKNLVDRLGHFDQTNPHHGSRYAMVALCIHTAEILKNNAVWHIVLKALEPAGYGNLMTLGATGTGHINNWSRSSRYIIQYLHVPCLIWDTNQQEFIKNKAFVVDDGWDFEPESLFDVVIFIKHDAYALSALEVKDGGQTILHPFIFSSVGIVTRGGINHILKKSTYIPCAATITLKATSSKACVQAIEGDMPLYAQNCIKRFALQVKLVRNENQEVKVEPAVDSKRRISAVASQVGHENVRVVGPPFNLTTDHNLSKLHAETSSSCKDFLDKLVSKKLSDSMKKFPDLDPLFVLCATAEAPIALPNEISRREKHSNAFFTSADF